MTLTLSNVPSGTYNVIIYSLGFDFAAAYEEAFGLAGGGAYPTYHVNAETGLAYKQSPAYRRMASTDPTARASGNYVQFDNVSTAADGSLVISATWESTAAGNTHQPAVNAIQLVKVLPITQQPNLSVASSPGNLTLSWPASANGFVLESRATLGSTANWLVVAGAPNPITGAGSLNVITGAASGAYYRLKK